MLKIGSELFLVLYSTEAVKITVFRLIQLVEQTRQKISTEGASIFNAKLQLNGYFDEDK
jgi:hypothetical protein